MQPDQFLRRAAWRVRRWFRRAADNEPIVSVEPPAPPVAPPPATPPKRGKRGRRFRRTGMAFLGTLGVLGLAYGALIGANSRVKMDLGAAPITSAGESHAVAAAAGLLVFADDRTIAKADNLLFVPSGRRMRERLVRSSATAVVARYVDQIASARGKADAALAEARVDLAAGGQASDADRIAARDALLRFNTRIARHQARLDADAPALASLLRALADSCEGEARDLTALSETPTLLAAPAAEARVYQARGVAFGWVMLLRGALLDAPTLAGATALEAAIPLEALSRAATRQPLFLFNGNASTPWAPSHVADAAADLARAAAGARAMAAAVVQSQP